MKTFPIMLDLSGRLAVVVGGGGVGLRKVQALLEAGARVRLVAAAIQEGLPASDSLEVRRQPYSAGLLAGARLVFACTDDRALNARIAADARAIGALVNAADQPPDCDFYMASVFRAGEVMVAVGSGGSAPGLAAFLSRRLAESLPPRVDEFAALLARIRDEAKTAVGDAHARMAIMKEVSGSAGYELFIAGGEGAVRKRFAELVSQAENR